MSVTRETVLGWVGLERERQVSLYGAQPHKVAGWLAILTEEVGEVARVANRPPLHEREYQDQVLHVAAVAVAILEQLGIAATPTCLGEMNWGDPAAGRERLKMFSTKPPLGLVT